MSNKYENISGKIFIQDVDRLGLNKPVAKISVDLKVAKSNVSSYLSGKLQPSASFLEKFYNHYKIEPGAIEVHEPEPEYAKTDYKEKYISAIERQIEVLNKAIEGNLTLLSSGQQLLLSTLRAHIKNEAIVRAKGSAEKAQKEVDSVSSLIFEYLGAHEEMGNRTGYSQGKV